MKKMNFQNIKNVLSRDEMKKIMAGSGGTKCDVDTCKDDYHCTGFCYKCSASGHCYQPPQ